MTNTNIAHLVNTLGEESALGTQDEATMLIREVTYNLSIQRRGSDRHVHSVHVAIIGKQDNPHV